TDEKDAEQRNQTSHGSSGVAGALCTFLEREPFRRAAFARQPSRSAIARTAASYSSGTAEAAPYFSGTAEAAPYFSGTAERRPTLLKAYRAEACRCCRHSA